MPQGKRSKKMLIKKGTPYPGQPKFKLDSAHLKGKEAGERESQLLDQPRVKDTKWIVVPRQHLVYVKHGKVPRITPKTPRLRR